MKKFFKAISIIMVAALAAVSFASCVSKSEDKSADILAALESQEAQIAELEGKISSLSKSPIDYFIGEFSGYFDYLGFDQASKLEEDDNGDEVEVNWTDENLKWIRSIYKVEFFSDGTFKQTLLNAQRENYAVDVEEGTYVGAQRYNPFLQDSDDFESKAFKADGTDREKALRGYHNIAGMGGVVPNFAESGIYFVNDYQLIMARKEADGSYLYKIFASKVGGEWIINDYAPYQASLVKVNTSIKVAMSKVEA